MDVGPDIHGGSPYDETITYDGGHDYEHLPHGDGFPAEDDLVQSELGQYRVDSVIGHGSMGRVYRGEHRSLGRTSALKVLSPGLVAQQPRMVERFWGEARAVAGLVHPNVVTVHNLGSDRGYHYIEMEYVPGGVSLKEVVVREGCSRPPAGHHLRPSGRSRAGRRPSGRPGASRRKAGQRAADLRGPRQARRLRPGAPACRGRIGRGTPGRYAYVHGPGTISAAPRAVRRPTFTPWE